MKRRVQVVVSRADQPFPEKAISEALLHAHAQFVMKYCRGPRYDFVLFRGGFSTAKVILELEEDVED